MDVDGRILLGTVAIEPNRWSTLDPSGAARTDVVAWLPVIAAAGFDGLELWDRHLPDDPSAAAGLIEGPVPVEIFNSYADLDQADPSQRSAAAQAIAATGARAAKFNVGNDAGSADAYAARIRDWVDELPDDVVLLCECHAGISIAEDPEVAAAIFRAVDRPGRVGAIVHTHESVEHLRTRFAAYGALITHVHVNHLDLATLSAPALADRLHDLRTKVELLTELRFRGSWTIEFVQGLLTDHDEPGALLEQAAADLVVLRSALGAVAR